MGITVENISKSFGSKQALKEVSFELNDCSVVGFLGPNGAGKSTLMKILTTLLRPDSGRAVVNGFDTQTQALKVRESVGYLSEQNPLYDHLYVAEYLRFCANARKISSKRIPPVAEQTGLTEVLKQKINTLSKGYRQRVGLAAALLHDPAVLLLDEPTTGLDPNQLIGIRNLIKALGTTKTIFFSSHILQEVEAVSDRVLILHEGRLVASQSLKDNTERENCLLVEFDYRVEEVLLKRLPQVQKVVNTHDLVWELHFDTNRDMRPVVFDFAHDNGLKIVQLHPKNTRLESIFSELTR